MSIVADGLKWWTLLQMSLMQTCWAYILQHSGKITVHLKTQIPLRLIEKKTQNSLSGKFGKATCLPRLRNSAVRQLGEVDKVAPGPWTGGPLSETQKVSSDHLCRSNFVFTLIIEFPPTKSQNAEKNNGQPRFFVVILDRNDHALCFSTILTEMPKRNSTDIR